jgi:hypothetical protein
MIELEMVHMRTTEDHEVESPMKRMMEKGKGET